MLLDEIMGFKNSQKIMVQKIKQLECELETEISSKTGIDKGIISSMNDAIQ